MNDNRKIKLFCFPYAGGSSATIYSIWKQYLHSNIELYPVELAGRGKRFKEKHYSTFEEVVDDMYNIIDKYIDSSEYAFFGHSMGCNIAYFLAKRIQSENRNPPRHIFFSGMYPPHIIKDEKILHNLPDYEFVEEVYKLGGMPKELIENSKFFNVFVPILKSDYRILENCDLRKYVDINKFKLNCDITVLNGNQDEKITDVDIFSWKECTNRSFESHEFNGGHFFIINNVGTIIDIINKKLGVSIL